MKNVDLSVPKVTCIGLAIFVVACIVKCASLAIIMMFVNLAIYCIEDSYKDFITDGEYIETIEKTIKDEETKRCNISEKLKKWIQQNNKEVNLNDFITKVIGSNTGSSESLISIINSLYNDQYFESLMAELKDIDEKIMYLKKEYNHYVCWYNKESKKVSNKLIMKACKYKKKDFKKIEIQ